VTFELGVQLFRGSQSCGIDAVWLSDWRWRRDDVPKHRASHTLRHSFIPQKTGSLRNRCSLITVGWWNNVKTLQVFVIQGLVVKFDGCECDLWLCERACKGRNITFGCSLLFGLKRASQHSCYKDNPADWLQCRVSFPVQARDIWHVYSTLSVWYIHLPNQAGLIDPTEQSPSWKAAGLQVTRNYSRLV
jgi:hypothetical protein